MTCTDNFELYAGHAYTFGTHFLTLGSEYGLALGGGRMASLFANGWIGERGDNGALAGLRIYFGQRDKSLKDRHRQDDPTVRPVSPDRCDPTFSEFGKEVVSLDGKHVAFCRTAF